MKTSYVHHLCIQTNSYLETIEFYTKGLGFELVQESPDFHGREFNTWLKLGTFYIELQTGKQNEQLAQINSNSEGLVHFCIWVEDLEFEVERLKRMNVNFLQKNKEIIYHVENGELCKLIAPEGTIIELRNNPGV
ncbi:glyoxalase [Lysinibacillus sp. 2017]|uniref:VOC family protein n=1 Tax=unclassified Lysinibacillus TaxID=2636778 RepID=UPI000D528ABE|nr:MULTISPECIES: VOC family protein [unclassified Lysinibacillus]AWE07299.1 glyoxalase [Lysinibacillus sp. 2017]TGN30794.1 VOC family protein [Lysinibacillus sp. S2017]